ncbi:MAG: hypothetical protein JSV05_05220 [Candidatus Bathyarchaeota archaeon]|nr:MAG: hypothetical protein JSV05_05220 [Candidatus Bathyarchaeota archaeon]
MRKIVRIPLLLVDPQYLREQLKTGPSELLLATPIESSQFPHDEEFLDGPATSRVAVYDFEADSEVLRPGVKFLPQGVGKTISRYDVTLPDIDDTEALIKTVESDSFIQLNTFAIVMKTIFFFESPDSLGREVTWAFESRQLQVRPRAGLWENALYERDSGSLQFFYFPSKAGYNVYTALSQDIVAHETAHAILDGVAPDLYKATRTESLALHEAIADLTAIMLTLLNEMIIFSVYAISSSQLDIASALSKIGKELGTEMGRKMRRDLGIDCLRVLNNKRKLDPASVDLTDPYHVSEVLSGAMFQVFLKCAGGLTEEEEKWVPEKAIDMLEDFEKRVLGAAREVSRLVFRALDYLPPGEVSLADFGRAMIAAHRAVNGERREQLWLMQELAMRGVVKDEGDLEVDTEIVGRKLKDVSCRELLESEAAAKRFAENHRDLLRIPSSSDFEVQPRLVRDRVDNRGKKRQKRDLVFRVTWKKEEEHDLGPRFASHWGYKVGTTLVLDWNTSTILSVLTTEQGGSQYSDRDRTLKKWMEQGRLQTLKESKKLHDQALKDKIIARKTGRTMWVTNSARVLCS